MPIEIEITKIDKDCNDKIMEISYKIKFTDSFRFMSSSLSSLVDNLSEGLHGEKCTYCKSCLDYMITQDDQLIFRCFKCKKNYEKDLQIYINSAMKTLINLFSYSEKVFILMNTWIVGKDLMKDHCLIKKLFITL